MATLDFNNLQLFKAYSSSSFVEIIGNSIEPLGKINTNLVSFDKETNKQKEIIKCYLGFDEIYNLYQQVTSGHIAIERIKAIKEANGGYAKSIWNSPPGGNASDPENIISRTLYIDPGIKSDYIIRAIQGAGKIEGKGLIVLNCKLTDATVIRVPLSEKQLVSLVYTLKGLLDSFIIMKQFDYAKNREEFLAKKEEKKT